MSKKYQIWDKKSKIITPNMRIFSPEEWIINHPACGIDEVKTVRGGGVINGNVCYEFNSMVDSYAKRGCNFSSCIEDQDYLDAIEEFENEQEAIASVPMSDETRIANALEDMVVMQELLAMTE